MTMLTKNSFIDEINKLYTVTARAKGLSENRVFIHVFKNAIIPILTGFPAQFVSAFLLAVYSLRQYFLSMELDYYPMRLLFKEIILW